MLIISNNDNDVKDKNFQIPNIWYISLCKKRLQITILRTVSYWCFFPKGVVVCTKQMMADPWKFQKS